jgi:pimeloyl-ACP methyl ester carboxylesterase
MWFTILGLVVLALLVPYVALKRETRELNDEVREARGGSYVELSEGVTHYELSGPEDGPVVVLVHGGSIPFYVWDAQAPALANAGHRVLRYTQYGRGYSDRPDTPYDRALYQRQLTELLSALGIDGPIDVVGVSFGGAIAATFTAENPDRVGKLALIAPVVDYSEGRALFDLAKIPVVSEWYARVFAVRAVVSRANHFFEVSGAPPIYAERFDAQTRFVGFERALLSFSRTDALTSYADTYAALGDQPKLLLWGAKDAEIPAHHMQLLRDTLTNLTYRELPTGTHAATTEHPEETNAALTRFLGTRSPSETPTIPTP